MRNPARALLPGIGASDTVAGLTECQYRSIRLPEIATATPFNVDDDVPARCCRRGPATDDVDTHLGAALPALEATPGGAIGAGVVSTGRMTVGSVVYWSVRGEVMLQPVL